MGWCRSSVENYYITPGDLSSQSELPNNFKNNRPDFTKLSGQLL